MAETVRKFVQEIDHTNGGWHPIEHNLGTPDIVVSVYALDGDMDWRAAHDLVSINKVLVKPSVKGAFKVVVVG